MKKGLGGANQRKKMGRLGQKARGGVKKLASPHLVEVHVDFDQNQLGNRYQRGTQKFTH
jgi:hypothetical protein